MLRTRKSGLSISIICLSLLFPACRGLTIPKVDDVYRRTIYFEVLEQDDKYIVLDKRSAHCRIQLYRHSLFHMGPVGEGMDRPLEECISIVGYDIDDYGKLVKAKNFLRQKAIGNGVKESD